MHFGYIDALRGYAILLVIAVHTSQVAVDLGSIPRTLFDQGARGVQLFFVTSALTLMMSRASRNEGVWQFYTRRFFRIAPMFWLAIAYFVWIDGLAPRSLLAPSGINLTQLILTSLFVNGWHPEYIMGVVPGGWSIAVEMAFYLTFPLIVMCIRGPISALCAVTISNYVAAKVLGLLWSIRALLWPEVSDELVSTLLNFWFPNQLPAFLVGILVYYLLTDVKASFSVCFVRLILIGSILLMLALAFYNKPIQLFSYTINIYSAYGICFGIVAFCLANDNLNCLVNPLVCHLGKISFSAYLLHFMILAGMNQCAAVGLDPWYYFGPTRGLAFFTLFFCFLVVATTVLATITYYLIERPMISLGNKAIVAASTKSLLT